MADTRFQIVTTEGTALTLDKNTVVKYITKGQDISDQEFTFFFQLCKNYKVNPFLNEAYLIKFNGQPATIVLDYKVLQKIADSNEHFKGMKHGIVVENVKGEIEERNGEFMIPGKEHLIAGWCEVLRDDREPTKAYAMFDECKGVKKDGTLNANWVKRPTFMIVKVAKAQALREAFPSQIRNVYTKEEIDSVEEAKPIEKETTAAPKTNVQNSIEIDMQDASVDENGEVESAE